MSNSYTPPDRSTYDPGWNDIPSSVTAAMNVSSTAEKPRIKLSKRVAFPMQSGASPSAPNVKTTSEGLPLPYSTAKYQPPPLINATLPPEQQSTSSVLAPPPPVAIFNPIQNVPTSTESNPSKLSIEPFDSVAAREFCHLIFMRLIDQMDKSIDAVKLAETRKRIDLLNDMWMENGFDEVVQQKLYDLGRALEKNDINRAEEEHRFLSTHHIDASMRTALRQIIHSISGIGFSSSNETDPVVLPSNEINTVQLMDVSTKPVVVDGSPFLTQAPIIPVSAPILPINQPIDDVTSNEENQHQQSNESNSSRSKTSRFGRILHL